MSELMMRVSVALERGDWPALLMLGTDLYSMACVSGDWTCMEMARDVVAAALLVVEHPGLGRVSVPLAMAVRERLGM